ncbi:pyridoxal-phosphate dependent enzyme [Longimicrobium terrae]|uniref:Threonine dehydratase n=1 Tax=Longimicrobium terrae TaxID=1639882 RepID=A0A841H209_9BACT|nr:threonine dehydratase [Longimicrobium terrae]MBB6072008.1 threonine dehydratase [Longimicrobium terrae]NNC29905.1 pyridoxal-phosphate dependent enzyme [Longimicrobium terrae]
MTPSPDPDPPFPTFADVLAADRRLDGVVRRTPLERSAWLSQRAKTDVLLKLELSQRTGSFKLRGAYNAVASLSPEARARGLVTASAGNHGQGVALAATLVGCRATVFVPADAPETKRRRIAGFGGDVRLVDGGYDDAHHEAEAFAARTGALYVHAFSDPAVVAGQGTVGLEILRERPDVRTLVVPVGGGGLIGGIGVVARAMGSGVRIIGAQTHETAAMHASLAAGRLTSPDYGETVCEGLSGDVDERSLALAMRVVDGIVLVSEDEVRRAIRRLYVEEGVVAEGSAAVAAAAVMQGALDGAEGPAAVVLTGGNVDARRLAGILCTDD